MSSIDGVEATPDSFRVSDVLNPNFSRSWHEAVAIVQEVASQLAPGASVPGPEDLLLDPNGGLQFGFSSSSKEHPVSSLATLLLELLEGTNAPPALRELADENAGPAPAHATVDSFQRALGFYERPARATDLQAIVSRLRTDPPAPNPKGEFERLRDKVVARAEAAPVGQEKPVRQGRTRQMVIAAAVLLFAIAAAIVVYARPGYVGASPDLTARVEQKVADTLAAGLSKLGVTAGTPVKSEGTLAEAPEPNGKSRRGVAGSSARGRTAPGVSKAGNRSPNSNALGGGSVGGAAGEPLSQGFVVLPHVGTREAMLTELGGGPIGTELGGPVTYSSSDRDVEPPSLNRPQLPREPKPGEDTGYFDVIVTENGTVDRIQLISPMLRFEERMLIAAAKAWQFRPAMRNGEPVRYRMRIAIIIPEKS